MFSLSILDRLSDSKSRGGWLNDLGYGRWVHIFLLLYCLRFIYVLGTQPSTEESTSSILGMINAYLVVVSGIKNGAGQAKER